ncbi:hypothetical protein SCMU_40510 [Sinomonas cyclohexanicum]|uniref:DUF4386 domain-containing protein n=1 Tax=Sinomonas cyclohexanicum TaxID=322009 RepID=A0ABM7Q0W1_SINCY|nr:DUF4386 domain-containing protein [Corynebacterium cyclohexanicum]BCT78209.1 hypothetical protein SCMU_40510 [Corynebacterium cyclohexanicum]
MASTRRTAIAIGTFFLITHVTSVGGMLLYGPVLANASYGSYLATPGASGSALAGALLEVILAIAIVGTGVAFFPVVRRISEGMALGYAALRTLEAGVIAVGVTPLVAAVAIAQNAGDAGSAGLVQALAAVHNWTFTVGPGLICPANTAVLAIVLFRSGLVPRAIPVLGLVGAPLVFVLNAAQLFTLTPQAPGWAGLAVIPIFAWEVSLALYLIIRGFRPAALARVAARQNLLVA